MFQFRPFIFVSSRVVNDERVEDAIRKMKALYNIDISPKIIKRVLNNFCKYMGMQDFSKNSLCSIVETKDDININKITKILDNEFEISLFLNEKLGEECFNYLNKPEKSLLIDGLKKYTKNPANLISDVAGSFESFLRRIGSDKGFESNSLNGIGQVAQALASKDNKIILPEHRNLCEFISTFRNPSSHKVQKNILEHWKIYEDTSIEVILLCLSSMRSIFEYIHKNKLIL